MSLFKLAIYFGLGLGATCPLLSLVYGGTVISLMSITLIFVILDLLAGIKIRLLYNTNSRLLELFLSWMLISVLASFYGFVYFININPNYSFSSIKHLPKILFYLSLTYLFIKQRYSHAKTHAILMGILCGIVLNIFWSIADAAMYYAIRESLTNNIFHAYITATNMRLGVASIVNGITIRSVGLNNDPAVLGFFAIVGTSFAIIDNKKWFIIFCFLSSIACISFIGFIGIFIVVVTNLYLGEIKLKDFLYFFILSGLFLVIICNSNNNIVEQAKLAVENKADNKIENEPNSSVRPLVIKKFPNAILNIPTVLILGTGYTTAVYPYYPEGLDWGAGSKEPTYIENTYIDNFFSFGLIGFMFFLLFYAKLFSSFRKIVKNSPNIDAKVIYSISMGILISYLFYHYTLYSVIMLISIIGIVYQSHNCHYKSIYFPKLT